MSDQSVGLSLFCSVCCLWPFFCGVGGWYIRKAVREGWRPSIPFLHRKEAPQEL